ncbi:MAG: 2-dehydro-3-deoxyphosphooctonate aldolase [Candidatus Celerinatantimonas neptuna]|nr:MAG: 2-dehydro-3-deoxyphosphooctonate aldolase [Candidatus Celerinatantimonas neptuna]
MTDLTTIRTSITEVDEQLLTLLAQRKKLAGQVAQYKLIHQKPIRDIKREKQLLTKLVDKAKTLELSPKFVTQVFAIIIENSVREQQRLLQEHQQPQQTSPDSLKVAFLGNKGSYSNIAVNCYFENTTTPVIEVGCHNFRDIVNSVEQRHADYALLPIENTSSGSINEVYDLLQQTSLSIIGELTIPVDHGILVKKTCDISQIQTLYGHPQPFSQCNQFLSQYPHIKFEVVDSSSKAMQLVAESHDHTIAALGSETGGRMYQLSSIQSHIANQQENYTRFIAVARNPIDVPQQIQAKTTFIMATGQHPGALADALQVLAARHINMTHLESRPVQGNPWQEIFYVDVTEHVESESMQQALADLTRTTRFIKVLGCYPCADIKAPTIPASVLAAQPMAAIQDRPTVIGRHQDAPLSSRQHKPEPTSITIGKHTLGNGHFLVMAGPDTLEDPNQLNQCVEIISDSGAAVLHGACFKSSSNPYDYSGPGLSGLDWLSEASRQSELPIMTEVTHIDKLRDICGHVDVLQIGAANMQNYPLLKAAGNSTRPIVLERGSVASLDEWLQAADYLLAQGNQQVILCERGIRTADHQTRSIIDLSAIALLRKRTHLPILLNPCDGVTQSEDIAPLAIAARQLGVDGIMLNIHPDPVHAKVAPKQSLNFTEFKALMTYLFQN